MEGDKEYVLTALAHGAAGESAANKPLYSSVFAPHWETTAGAGDVQKGDWIADVTREPAALQGQSSVAMETLTIAHEGFLLI